ncbi:MAG: hypothetical protein KC425_00565 [Anaerolineales bacterium]|nr:hypothetical protein [Anaerolineales bacterium]
MEMEQEFCAAVSAAAGEPLAGQALTARVWFLLEVERPWSAKATTDNDLPRPVQDWLAGLTAGVPDSRLQFIRQLPGNKVTLFIGVVDETAPRLYRFEAERYADLFALDVPAVLAGAAAFERYRWHEPLYLVCTNGRRDRCCARFGAATYRALQARVGRAAWQTTHVGGHRFAPNVVTFPEGIFYSRVDEADVPEFVAAVARREVALRFYRGRACFGEAAQAAEYFVRRDGGILAVDALRHLQTTAEGTAVRVRFGDAAGGVHEVVLGVETAVPAGILASCGKPQVKPVTHYRLLRSPHEPTHTNQIGHG